MCTKCFVEAWCWLWQSSHDSSVLRMWSAYMTALALPCFAVHCGTPSVLTVNLPNLRQWFWKSFLQLSAGFALALFLKSQTWHRLKFTSNPLMQIRQSRLIYLEEKSLKCFKYRIKMQKMEKCLLPITSAIHLWDMKKIYILQIIDSNKKQSPAIVIFTLFWSEASKTLHTTQNKFSPLIC